MKLLLSLLQTSRPSSRLPILITDKPETREIKYIVKWQNSR